MIFLQKGSEESPRNRMIEDLILSGTIVTGVQKAAFFTKLDWVRNQCLEKLGFIPFPGTLNIKLHYSSFPLAEKLQKAEGITLIPPDSNFCEAKTFPVSIGHVSGAVLIPPPNVKIHENHIIEIISPVRLKSFFGLKDGDEFSLSL